MTLSAKRIAGWAVVLSVGLIAYAWFDGGEQALRPIEQQLAVPQVAS